MCTVLNALFYVPGVLNVVAYICRIVLLSGVVLEVSKTRDWLYVFRSNGCASFECMLRCPLWFRMVDG